MNRQKKPESIVPRKFTLLQEKEKKKIERVAPQPWREIGKPTQSPHGMIRSVHGCVYKQPFCKQG